MYENNERYQDDKNDEYQETIDIITMSNDEWEELIKSYYLNLVKRARYPLSMAAPLTISCNPSKEVWFCIKTGKHQEDEREYIDLFRFAALEQIIEKFLEFSEMGGRLHFRVDYEANNSLYVSIPRTNEKLCYLKIE